MTKSRDFVTREAQTRLLKTNKMLIRFQLENFRSFNEKKTFHLIKQNYQRFKHHVHEDKENLDLLKVASIYGGNASGKTNLVRGIEVVKRITTEQGFLDSSEGKKLLYPFQLNSESVNKSSHFQVDFKVSERIFIYNIKISRSKKNNLTIEYESLQKVLDMKKFKTSKIFERIYNRNLDETTFNFSDNNKELETLEKGLSRLIGKSNSSFLFSDIFPIKDIELAKSWFEEKLHVLFPAYEFKDIALILNKKPEYLEIANSIIRFAKLGIKKLEIEEHQLEPFIGSESRFTIQDIKDKLEFEDSYQFEDANGNHCTAIINDQGNYIVLRLVAIHINNQGNEVRFQLHQESRGTNILIQILPALILPFGEEAVFFIDEISASLHPILMKEIIKQYLEHNIAKSSGQIVFNTHEDFMLDSDILRQDEIWLLEKNSNGESDIFPLSDFANVRHDLDFRRNYLKGKFGGVPFEEKPEKLEFARTE